MNHNNVCHTYTVRLTKFCRCIPCPVQTKILDAIETENYLNKFSITSTQKITSHTYFQGFDFKADS